MIFCGGRTDALSDGGASEFLEPKIIGEPDENITEFREFMGLMGLTPKEYAALHGAGYALGQVGECAGLFCQRDVQPKSALSNIFFKNIVDYQWKRDDVNAT